jgi:hypothetical protein
MPHIEILLSMLALVGVALVIDKKLNNSFGLSLLYAAVGISVILYIGTILNFLETTTITIRVIGWLSFGAWLLQFKRRLPKADEIYILISVVGFYLFCQTAPYSIFPFIDDYSHWGRMSRYIAENNRLIINSDLIGVKDYPPIAALFHYFFTHFSGYQDNIAIFANGVLAVIFSAPLLSAVSQYKTGEKKTAFALTSLSIYSLFWIFGMGLHSLWADLLIGFSFGIGLYIYFHQGWKDKNTALLATIPILFYTVQIKQIGILFALLTLAIIGIDYLKYDKHKLVRKLFSLMAIVIALLSFEWTWKNYLNTQGISRIFKINLSLNDLLIAFNPATATDRHIITISRFIDYFFFSHHLSTYWFIVTVLMLTGLGVFKKSYKPEIKITALALTYLLFVAYSIVLLILYLFAFSGHEGSYLASIDRYILTYILGMLILFGGVLLNIGAGEKTKKFKIFLISMAVLVILPNAGRMLLDGLRVVMNTYPNNTAGQISVISKYVKEKTPENSKIYIIWSEDSNDQSVIFSYYLMPRYNNTECIFVKPPFSVKKENDIWSCTMSIEQLEERLSEYDYLLLAKTSEEFVNYFAKNLNIEHDIYQPVLYKIFHENKIKLEIVK